MYVNQSTIRWYWIYLYCVEWGVKLCSLTHMVLNILYLTNFVMSSVSVLDVCCIGKISIHKKIVTESPKKVKTWIKEIFHEFPSKRMCGHSLLRLIITRGSADIMWFALYCSLQLCSSCTVMDVINRSHTEYLIPNDIW